LQFSHRQLQISSKGNYGCSILHKNSPTCKISNLKFQYSKTFRVYCINTYWTWSSPGSQTGTDPRMRLVLQWSSYPVDTACSGHCVGVTDTSRQDKANTFQPCRHAMLGMSRQNSSLYILNAAYITTSISQRPTRQLKRYRSSWEPILELPSVISAI